jgi:site-specific DNA-methyltransferase (adenine-specific)
MRVEKFGDATLYLGDCLEILPTLPKVDAVITSPPYNLGTTGTTSIRQKFGHAKSLWKRAAIAEGYGEHTDDMPYDEYEAWQKSVVSACWARLTDSGAMFYNHKPRSRDRAIWLPLRCLPDEVVMRQIVIWKRNAGLNFSPCHYMSTHEWVIVLAKQDYMLRDRGASGVGDVWEIPALPDPDHPAPFPLRLPMTILETNTFQTVLDPFTGSGTTGVACMKSGRAFMGIEREPRFFDLACRRIEQAYKQRPLFEDEPPRKPEQLGIDA